MAHVLQPSGIDLSGDKIRPSDEQTFGIGDADGDAAAAPAPVYKEGGATPGTHVTTSFQDSQILDLQKCTELVLLVDYVKGAGTSAELRVLFGDADAAAALASRESRFDDSTPAYVKWEAIDHQFLASFRGFITINRPKGRYCKVQYKASGGINTTDKLAVSAYGTCRERA